MWLVVFGLQGNLYRVRCTACDLVINSHLHTIQKHEDSARHKQNLAAKQKSSAAVQAFKAALTTGRDRTAAKRKEQMEDPATVTQFAAVFYLLKLGRPMTDIEHTPTSPGLQPLQPSTGKTTAHGRLQRPFTLSCASMTWRVLPDGQEVFEEVPAEDVVIPDLADRNMCLQLCRGLPPPGSRSRPSAAVEAVLALYPGLHARRNDVPQQCSGIND
ncbi:hypothetical protein QJQ45_000698 [Haematococcus lacustris]|nr:hypothetical protein QJQ45_000698 [Haematococcus lacustris]